MDHPDQSQHQVLSLLKERPDAYITGTFMASRLGLTRTAIWKHIQSLKDRGYAIQSHSRLGYRLTQIPDTLFPEEILPALPTQWLGKTYHFFPQISSTNDHALSLAVSGAPHGTIVLAETQTAGRGRLQRPWLSNPGRGIYFSLLLMTPLPVRQAPLSTMVAALALTTVLRHHYSLPAAVKWPNDVLIANKKVCGILTEMQSDQDQSRFIVIGIGINANHSPEDLTGAFRYPPTSVAMECGHPIRRQELFLEYLRELECRFDQFIEEGFGALLGDFEAVSAIIGKDVTIQCGNQEVSGRAVGFTPEGGLRLLISDGKEEVVWVGDVTHVQGVV